MSNRSIRGLVRLLLLFHLLAVAWSVVVLSVMLPGNLKHDSVKDSFVTIGLTAGFIAPLFLIGVSSTRLSVGKPVRPADWVIHGVWNAIFLFSYFGNSPFHFRPQASPGSLEGFAASNGMSQLWVMITPFLLVAIYSAIPLISARFFYRLDRINSERRRKLTWMISLLGFVAAILSTLLARHEIIHLNEPLLAMILGTGLTVSFATAAFRVVQGDNAAGRLLLWEIGLFTVLRLA